MYLKKHLHQYAIHIKYTCSERCIFMYYKKKICNSFTLFAGSLSKRLRTRGSINNSAKETWMKSTKQSEIMRWVTGHSTSPNKLKINTQVCCFVLVGYNQSLFPLVYQA